AGAAAPAAPRPPGGSSAPRRRPAALPGGVLADSVEAADHLVRLATAVVLVDGYNVSMTAWPEEPIDAQRRRLVAALDELHARTGADPVVVFDGVAAGGATVDSRCVRILFTDAAVEADDVVVDLVDGYPPSRPVVVVSSDERVRRGAAERGANVVSSAQFLVVLRR
ncbi:MAG: NYN domain-containing protein, partial [Actinobacteria bacterium]|nr:NYN domain-containing protein [Actinomycetota bacterium]